MIGTPDTSCLSLRESRDVYPPSEDSFLFLDALEKESSFLNSQTIDISLEIGSGSGVISAFTNFLIKNSRFHIYTDISPAACVATRSVIRSNKPATSISWDGIQCSLCGPLLSKLHASVDLILFNPPYVPTSEEEHRRIGISIDAAWSGGRFGREVIDAFLPQAIQLLSPKGCMYLLLSDENDPDDVHKLVSNLSDGRLSVRTVLRRRANNESLGIYCYANWDLIHSD